MVLAEISECIDIMLDFFMTVQVLYMDMSVYFKLKKNCILICNLTKSQFVPSVHKSAKQFGFNFAYDAPKV